MAESSCHRHNTPAHTISSTHTSTVMINRTMATYAAAHPHGNVWPHQFADEGYHLEDRFCVISCYIHHACPRPAYHGLELLRISCHILIFHMATIRSCVLCRPLPHTVRVLQTMQALPRAPEAIPPQNNLQNSVSDFVLQCPSAARHTAFCR